MLGRRCILSHPRSTMGKSLLKTGQRCHREIEAPTCFHLRQSSVVVHQEKRQFCICDRYHGFRAGNPAVGGADFQNIHRAGRNGQEGGVAYVDESGNSRPENVGRYAVGWCKALAGLGVPKGSVLDIGSVLGSRLCPILYVDRRHQTRWDGLNGGGLRTGCFWLRSISSGRLQTSIYCRMSRPGLIGAAVNQAFERNGAYSSSYHRQQRHEPQLAARQLDRIATRVSNAALGVLLGSRRLVDPD